MALHLVRYQGASRAVCGAELPPGPYPPPEVLDDETATDESVLQCPDCVRIVCAELGTGLAAAGEE